VGARRVLDVRLVCDDDARDFSGLDVAITTDRIIPRSCTPPGPPTTSFAALGGEAEIRRRRLGEGARTRVTGLLDAAEAALHRLGINRGLVITAEPGRGWRTARPDPGVDRTGQAALELLSRSSRPAAQALPERRAPDPQAHSAGHRGSGVVQIAYTQGGVEAASAVVKFGERDNLRHEIGNYTRL